MTCNLGGDIPADGLGFQPAGREGRVKDALRRHFTPEFLGRLDAVVAFKVLEKETMADIAQKYLNQLRDRASATGIVLQFPEALAAELAAQCKKEGGARQIRKLVQQQVEGPLAFFLLKNAKKPAKLKVKLDAGKATFYV
jgi:ATP-dependent Clp protease ATP-binding subunit ClpC